MTLKELKKVNKSLSRADKKNIAAKFKVTESYIIHILNGRRNNQAILVACIDLALRNKRNKEKVNENISKKIAAL